MGEKPGRPLWLLELLDQEVEQKIQRDPRTIANPRTFLGWPKDQIFHDVLGAGQADFSSPVGHLSSADRALLYARYNQPRHLDELAAAFQALFSGSNRAGRPTVIDLGCGPFTAGLALAAMFGQSQPFRYYGVDRAESMLTLASKFATSAKQKGAFHEDTSWSFGDDLNSIDFGPSRGELNLVVASYLLASPTLNVEDLVVELLEALQRIGPGPAAVLYTNSAHPIPNVKYPRFRDLLVEGGFEAYVDDVETFWETKNPKALRYALFFKPPQTTISIR